jgi:hypothetical protein
MRKPTDKRTFPRDQFLTLRPQTKADIIEVCEEVHIPEMATRAVLLFAEYFAHKKDFVMASIPFALYQDGKRYVTEETLALEADIMHLAMASSVRHHINKLLTPYGIQFELGHCCDIQMHELANSEEAMMRSHDGNIYRADKLRSLTVKQEQHISLEDFLAKNNNPLVSDFSRIFFGTLFQTETA